ncbi:hypothetical protein [Streptomyces brasiliensis]|uniref:Uncharacterized protein n=1 Tax=Streptomyces brasiliensis TaxID=1954 RepID=A0A917KBG0_9ACTN|nr:hypothetical protein [Streptomyces brasiliensis]GGJ06923.1 hypothetical protein GCM10010121_016690 [Streptomyces brasiliensis]
MVARAWGHRERLLAFGGLGVLLVVCGAIATATGAADGPAVALTGLALTCWEGLGLWVVSLYRR